MSATLISTKPGGWTGQVQSKDRIRTYSLVHLVRTDSGREGPVTVDACPSLPTIGMYYVYGDDFDFGARLKTRTVRQSGQQKRYWEVVDSYSSQSDGEDQEPEENPLARPPKRRFSYERRIIHQNEDKDGKSYCNSAKEPFGPEVSAEERGLLVMTITRNEATFPIAISQDYQGCVNLGDFYGHDKDAVLLADIGAEDNWENGVYYWACYYKFVFDKNLWIPHKELDRGSYYWEGGDDHVGKPFFKRPGIDGTGCASTSLVHLNGIGDLLTADQIADGEFKYVEFRKYDRVDFNALDLEW